LASNALRERVPPSSFMVYGETSKRLNGVNFKRLQKKKNYLTILNLVTFLTKKNMSKLLDKEFALTIVTNIDA